jgi:hypothetical protein
MEKPPTKIRLVPDEWHIHHVGRLPAGRLFWVDEQLYYRNRKTTDFVCTYVFDNDGQLTSHNIESLGVRGGKGTEDDARIEAALDRHLAALGKRTAKDIWIRPFSLKSQGMVFGLVPRQLGNGTWRVEAMPGNTLSFFAPWDEGEYDT